ncbi:hypothetical protein JL721_12100 [Aureococcus anophagefferens]|nr:hypothetical protein JL721_12100 [Aureococcus anophagefferens]
MLRAVAVAAAAVALLAPLLLEPDVSSHRPPADFACGTSTLAQRSLAAERAIEALGWRADEGRLQFAQRGAISSGQHATNYGALQHFRRNVPAWFGRLPRVGARLLRGLFVMGRGDVVFLLGCTPPGGGVSYASVAPYVWNEIKPWNATFLYVASPDAAAAARVAAAVTDAAGALGFEIQVRATAALPADAVAWRAPGAAPRGLLSADWLRVLFRVSTASDDAGGDALSTYLAAHQRAFLVASPDDVAASSPFDAVADAQPPTHRSPPPGYPLLETAVASAADAVARFFEARNATVLARVGGDALRVQQPALRDGGGDLPPLRGLRAAGRAPAAERLRDDELRQHDHGHEHGGHRHGRDARLPGGPRGRDGPALALRGARRAR